MPLADHTIEQMEKLSIPALLALIKEVKDFPVIKDMDEATKPQLITAIKTYFEKQQAPPPPKEEKKPKEEKRVEFSVEDALRHMADAGFRNKEEVMSCLDGAEKAQKMLKVRVLELDKREEKIAEKEREIEKIEQLLRTKTGELEEKIQMNKVLVQQLHDAKK